MDTKSKKYHKLAVGLILLIILLPSLAMMVIRPHYVRGQNRNLITQLHSSSFLSTLIGSNYVLYAEEQQRKTSEILSPFDVFFPSALVNKKTSETDQKDSEKEKSEKTAEEKTETATEEVTAETAGTGNSELSSSELNYDNYPHNKYRNDVNGQGYTSQEAIMNSYNDFLYVFSDWNYNFSTLRSYVKYQVRDASGKILDSNTSDNIYTILDGMKQDQLGSDYAFGAVITYDQNGSISSSEFFSGKSTNGSQVLNEAARQTPCSDFNISYGMTAPFQKPQGRTYVYLMNRSDFDSMTADDMELLSIAGVHSQTEDLFIVFLTLMALVAGAALLLPFIRPLETGNEKIFHAPFELAAAIPLFFLVFGIIVSLDSHFLSNQSIFNVMTSIGMNDSLASALQYLWGFAGWTAMFASVYWAAGCMRFLFTMGSKNYIKERVLIYRIWPWTKKLFRRTYSSLLHLNLKDDTTKSLIKIVLINFIVLGFISLMWFWGIAALVVYSIALFLLLRKYSNDLKDQYSHLLDATNQLAEGNLNGTIPEDLGIFEPFREEIIKIQSGFRKAVDEEVKSQKMKTELITNVSHDLKTPLTAIITYVDLLKRESITEEERAHYIDILDQKSARLKLLIEDLFEISKATSRTITLNLADVDLINLIQQVKLELSENIDSSDVYFRWHLPEEKIILSLDGQKTYRIFENLLVNITKYAMPGTRAYIGVKDAEACVSITMKNISASELNFNPSEITERFVRGDVSRNTEGSGLGLAIAKSFTELQGGTLEVLTDADLFTVQIVFPKP